jgi:hypothetical protein
MMRFHFAFTQLALVSLEVGISIIKDNQPNDDAVLST